MPTIQIDLILLAIWSILCFGSGWEVNSWRIEAKQGIQLQNQIKATNTANLKINTVAQEFEIADQNTRISQANLLEKWNIADETPHNICNLSASAIQLLASATSAKTAHSR